MIILHRTPARAAKFQVTLRQTPLDTQLLRATHLRATHLRVTHHKVTRLRAISLVRTNRRSLTTHRPLQGHTQSNLAIRDIHNLSMVDQCILRRLKTQVSLGPKGLFTLRT